MTRATYLEGVINAMDSIISAVRWGAAYFDTTNGDFIFDGGRYLVPLDGNYMAMMDVIGHRRLSEATEKARGGRR